MRGFPKGSRRLAAALFLLWIGAPGAFAQLSFTAQPDFLTNREARVRLSVPAGAAARVDVSTNAIEWNGFLTVAAGAVTPTSITHTDSFAPYTPVRYYRAEQLAAGVVTGDNIPTANGDIVIHPVTHASFVMTWNGITIYNDPDTGNYTGLPKADLILISHDHTDHWDNTVIANQKNTTVTIITPKAVTTLLTASLRPACITLSNGMSTNILGIQVDAVPAYNASGAIYHTNGIGNGYVLTLGGKRIYISGDTGDIPETRALQNIDVAFVCVNVPYTMTVAQAALVTRAFAPRIVYPYHFRNGDNTFANLTQFKSLVGTDLGIEVRIRKWY
jgi:L-ascorbate metabolism protein UlaG (beta-lactamase superfamily)